MRGFGEQDAVPRQRGGADETGDQADRERGPAGIAHSEEHDAGGHAERKSCHDEARRNMAAAEPAPQNAPGYCDRHCQRKHEARGDRRIADSGQIDDKVCGHRGLQTVEREAGERQCAQARRREHRSQGRAEIRQLEHACRHAGGIEKFSHGLQHYGEDGARRRAEQHGDAPAKPLGHLRREHAGEQQAGRHRGLLERKHQRQVLRRRAAAEQMRAGRSRHRRTAAADNRGEHEQQRLAGRQEGGAGGERHQRELTHAQCAMAHDEAAAAELHEKGGDRRQPEIDADPGGRQFEVQDDRRRDHRGQRFAERDESLLHEHRPQSEHQVICGTGGQFTPSMRRKRNCQKRSQKPFGTADEFFLIPP